MTDYDEIDQFVDQLFRAQEQAGGDSETLHGEVLSGDWRIERIDEIIQDSYDEAIWWHNNRVSEGSCPKCGLRGEGHFCGVPEDPRWPTSGVGPAGIVTAGAAGGGGGGSNATSIDRNTRTTGIARDEWHGGFGNLELVIGLIVAIAAVVVANVLCKLTGG